MTDSFEDLALSRVEGSPFHSPRYWSALARRWGLSPRSWLLSEGGAPGAGLVLLRAGGGLLGGDYWTSIPTASYGGILGPAPLRAEIEAGLGSWCRGGRRAELRQEGRPGFSTTPGERRGRAWTSLDAGPWGCPEARRAARKAEKSGLVFRDCSLDEFVGLFLQTQRWLGSPALEPELFGDWARAFGAGLKLWGVSPRGGRALACGFFLVHGQALHMAFLGWDRAASGLRPNDLLFREVLVQARDLGLSRVDWGRSALGSGALAFKLKWGEPAPMATKVFGGPDPFVHPSRFPYNLASRFYRLLPAGLAGSLGPRLSRSYS